MANGPYIYDPYGNCTASDGSACLTSTQQPYRFTGRRFDAETGLLYYRARYYSPVIGRFLQTDPVGYSADLNLYTYVGNDPTDKADPSGSCTPERCAADYDFNGIQAVDVTYSWNGQSGITRNLRPDIGSLASPASSRTASNGNSRNGSQTAQLEPGPPPFVAGEIAAQVLKPTPAGSREEDYSLVIQQGGAVLGTLGHYEELAKRLKAPYFSMPPEEWQAMERAGTAWPANRAFLDMIVARGGSFVLSDPPFNAPPESGFGKEIIYLQEKYKSFQCPARYTGSAL